MRMPAVFLDWKAIMKRIKEVIVVEGKSDTKQIQRAVDADTIETRGSAISDETLALIDQLAQTRGVIVFTDPDFSGEKKFAESLHVKFQKRSRLLSRNRMPCQRSATVRLALNMRVWMLLDQHWRPFIQKASKIKR